MRLNLQSTIFFLCITLTYSRPQSRFEAPRDDVYTIPVYPVAQPGEACGQIPGYDLTVMCSEGYECSDLIANGVCKEYEPIDYEDLYSCEQHREDAFMFILDHSHLPSSSIWVPECNKSNPVLYKKRQCNFRKGVDMLEVKECFHVDEQTGLLII